MSHITNRILDTQFACTNIAYHLKNKIHTQSTFFIRFTHTQTNKQTKKLLKTIHMDLPLRYWNARLYFRVVHIVRVVCSIFEIKVSHFLKLKTLYKANETWSYKRRLIAQICPKNFLIVFNGIFPFQRSSNHFQKNQMLFYFYLLASRLAYIHRLQQILCDIAINPLRVIKACAWEGKFYVYTIWFNHLNINNSQKGQIYFYDIFIWLKCMNIKSKRRESYKSRVNKQFLWKTCIGSYNRTGF